MTDSQEYPHTAIPSWSGFLYQGKIALYYVLRLLSSNQAQCNNYTLQLDSLDDFAIMKDHEIVSIHQVKARRSNNFSSYSAAFSELKDRANSYSCKKAFFHLAKEIADKDISKIESEFSPVKIFCYEDNVAYCVLDDVDAKIENLVSSYFETQMPGDEWRRSPDYLKKVRIYLDQVIMKKVIIIHSRNHETGQAVRDIAYNDRVSFGEFVDLLETDLNQLVMDSEYFFYLILNDLNKYYQEYCIENVEDDKDLQKLSFYLHSIQNLNHQNLLRFLRNIMPQRKVKFESLADYKDYTLVKEEVQDAFFQILKELKKTDFCNITSLMSWKISGHDSYYPTTIKDGPSNLKKICQRVVENAINTDLDVMYEKSNLITLDIETASILASSERIIDVDDTGGGEHRITNWKKTAFVKLESVREIING